MKITLLTVLFLGVWGAPSPLVREAAAAPRKSSRKLTKEELQLRKEELERRKKERQYNALMKPAKAAAKKGKHAAAIALYDKALEIFPGSPEALTDQGWSAFLLNDLERAERVTREALVANRFHWARVMGAAAYNLGRILEAKKDRAGAIGAYKESLSLRPNRVVREALAKLDPAAAADADPLKPQLMLGPFATPAGFCQTLEGDERTNCPTSTATEDLTNVGAPYETVTLIRVGTGWELRCFIAFKLVNKGWFVERQGGICPILGDVDHDVLSFEAIDLVPGGNREVVMRAADRYTEEDTESEDTDMGIPMVDKECLGWLTACGVGQTGVPTCLRMQFAWAQACGSGFKLPWDWQLEPVFSGGQVEVKSKGKLDPDARALLGHRPLAFP